MTTPSFGRYEPLALPPSDSPDLSRAIEEELQRVAHAMQDQSIQFMYLEEQNAEPDRVCDGMVARADGTNWDPGSGRGVYWYDEDTTAWVLLGGGGGWQYLGSFDPTVPEEITGIPATATRVCVSYVGLSTGSASVGINIALGDNSSGIGNGYSTTGTASVVNNDTAVQAAGDARIQTNGRMPITTANYQAADLFSGSVIFSKRDTTSNNTWVGTGLTGSNVTTHVASVLISAGYVDVPGVLNKVKLTDTSAGDDIDAGTVYVWYQ